MSEKKFSKQHEWVSVEGDVATIGITKHAAEMLGDIVFVELPEKGKNVKKKGQAGVVESTKAASDVYTPITGEIIETNQSVVDDPGAINKDPEDLELFRINYLKRRKLDHEYSKKILMYEQKILSELYELGSRRS